MFPLCDGPSQMRQSPEESTPPLDNVNAKLVFALVSSYKTKYVVVPSNGKNRKLISQPLKILSETIKNAAQTNQGGTFIPKTARITSHVKLFTFFCI